MSPIKPEPIKQKPEALIDQFRNTHISTKGNNETPGSNSNYSQLNSSTRIKSPKKINKQFNAQGSTKYLNRFYSVESMAIETDNIIANLNLEDRVQGSLNKFPDFFLYGHVY